MAKNLVFTRNKYGIAIVKCCASCSHKACDNRTRLCLIGEGQVPSNYLCRQWDMSKTFEVVGKGGGMVKSKAYLEYACDVLCEENKKALAASSRKELYTRKTIEEIRYDYEKIHGTIYENI